MIISCLTFLERTGRFTKGIDRRHDIQVFEAIVKLLARAESSRGEEAWKHKVKHKSIYFGRSRLVDVINRGGV
jgi:hypothetical protein